MAASKDKVDRKNEEGKGTVARSFLPFSFFLFTFAFAPLGCHNIHLVSGPQDKLQKPDNVPAALALPSKNSFRVSQFVFHANIELKRELPIFHELAGLHDQVYKELQLPETETLVNVYLFEDRDHYERFMRSKYPELPKRRAFFVAQPHGMGAEEDMLVYTYWGDRVQEDLRHELTHALLHSVLKDVPLWLDEGLAEYYEVPPDWKGTHYQHLEQLCHGRDKPFHPDLARLEQMSQVQQMSPAEYREAWAWVHLLLRDKPEAKKVLLDYVQQLRVNPKPGPLGPKLAAALPFPDQTLEKHLAQLDAGTRILPAAAVK